jgi:hypothetical protein
MTTGERRDLEFLLGLPDILRERHKDNPHPTGYYLDGERMRRACTAIERHRLVLEALARDDEASDRRAHSGPQASSSSSA